MSKRSKLFLKGMRRKTKIAYLLVVGVLVALTIRVVYINVANGKEYSEAVVLQMDYNSTDIPYERGEILDRNGNVLANSEKTYSLILEPVNILITEKGKAATRAAVLEYFDVSGDDFDKHIANEDSYYEVVLKDLPYTKVKAFEDYCKTDEGADVIGVRFETVYKRNYPNGSLACHLLGYGVHLSGRFLPPRALCRVLAGVPESGRGQGALSARRSWRYEGEKVPEQRHAG